MSTKKKLPIQVWNARFPDDGREVEIQLGKVSTQLTHDEVYSLISDLLVHTPMANFRAIFENACQVSRQLEEWRREMRRRTNQVSSGELDA